MGWRNDKAEKALVDGCELCHRKGVGLTRHHLIPKSTQSSKWFKNHCEKDDKKREIYICFLCHSGIHSLYNEKDLARKFNTLELLLADETIKKYIVWAAKQKDL